jgi:release factor glutamine methyltransferase
MTEDDRARVAPRPADAALSPLEAAVAKQLRAAGCVFAEDEARLLAAAATTSTALHRMVDRRCAGVPLEHVVGFAEFCGLRIAVDPGVFVPRRRTEFLVRCAAAQTRRDDTVVDVCCGSGAVGAALAAEVGRLDLSAVDIDPVCVRCAQRNIEDAGGHAYEGDLFDPLPATLRGTVDVVVANAPYVPTDSIALMPSEARDHEPRIALDGGDDGIDVQRRVIAEAPSWLSPGGALLIETSGQQAPLTRAAFEQAGFDARTESDDELAATVVVGRLPAPAAQPGSS